MAHPLEFNTIHERSAESVQPRAAPVKAGSAYAQSWRLASKARYPRVTVSPSAADLTHEVEAVKPDRAETDRFRTEESPVRRGGRTALQFDQPADDVLFT